MTHFREDNVFSPCSEKTFLSICLCLIEMFFLMGLPMLFYVFCSEASNCGEENWGNPHTALFRTLCIVSVGLMFIMFEGICARHQLHTRVSTWFLNIECVLGVIPVSIWIYSLNYYGDWIAAFVLGLIPFFLIIPRIIGYANYNKRIPMLMPPGSVEYIQRIMKHVNQLLDDLELKPVFANKFESSNAQYNERACFAQENGQALSKVQESVLFASALGKRVLILYSLFYTSYIYTQNIEYLSGLFAPMISAAIWLIFRLFIECYLYYLNMMRRNIWCVLMIQDLISILLIGIIYGTILYNMTGREDECAALWLMFVCICIFICRTISGCICGYIHQEKKVKRA